MPITEETIRAEIAILEKLKGVVREQQPYLKDEDGSQEFRGKIHFAILTLRDLAQGHSASMLLDRERARLAELKKNNPG